MMVPQQGMDVIVMPRPTSPTAKHERRDDGTEDGAGDNVAKDKRKDGEPGMRGAAHRSAPAFPTG
jgi:hypothetical protein